MYLLLSDEERKELGEHYASLISSISSIPVETVQLKVVTTDSDLVPENLKDLILDILEDSREEGSIQKYKAAALIQTMIVETLLNCIQDEAGSSNQAIE